LTSSDQEISVHQIFGLNLRELCKRTGTIAEVADHLGVNRVQMTRILTGESFPKPGLMKRICDHFSVNARILLEPLAELEAEKRRQGRGDVRGMSGHLIMHFLVAITRLMRKT
jgi:transcriptional regulator with XRE-family HTH domain